MNSIHFKVLQSITFLILSCPLLIGSAPVYPSNEAGTIVCMFYSGTNEMRKEIKVNDTLTVYRKKSPYNFYEAGKIVILSLSGKYYIQGRILQGKLEENDLAKKDNFTCIIISLGGPC